VALKQAARSSNKRAGASEARRSAVFRRLIAALYFPFSINARPSSSALARDGEARGTDKAAGTDRTIGTITRPGSSSFRNQHISSSAPASYKTSRPRPVTGATRARSPSRSSTTSYCNGLRHQFVAPAPEARTAELRTWAFSMDMRYLQYEALGWHMRALCVRDAAASSPL